MKNKWRTRVKLNEIGVISEKNRVLCQGFEDTIDHLLFSCDFSRTVLMGTLRHLKLAPPRADGRIWMSRVTKGKSPLAKSRRGLGGGGGGCKFLGMRHYSGKIGYKALRVDGERPYWAKLVWCGEIFPRYQFILWMAMKNKWRIRVKLNEIGVISEKNRVLCQGFEETIDHLLFSCDFSRTVLMGTLYQLKLAPPRADG
ncbi:hypothetical protein Dimus_025213 [Dionaea muscipula]